jgi:hypothetical protein
MGARGVVRSVANAAPSTADNGMTWVAVRALDMPEVTASQSAAASGTESGIQPDDWVLRGAAGALSEGTAVKLPQM